MSGKNPGCPKCRALESTKSHSVSMSIWLFSFVITGQRLGLPPALFISAFISFFSPPPPLPPPRRKEARDSGGKQQTQQHKTWKTGLAAKPPGRDVSWVAARNDSGHYLQVSGSKRRRRQRKAGVRTEKKRVSARRRREAGAEGGRCAGTAVPPRCES